MMQRRSFLGAVAGLLVAPAVTRAVGLMPVKAWDDTAMLQAMIDDAARVGGVVRLRPRGAYITRAGIRVPAAITSILGNGAEIRSLSRDTAPIVRWDANPDTSIRDLTISNRGDAECCLYIPASAPIRFGLNVPERTDQSTRWRP